MILQALTEYYDALASNGMIARAGWSNAKIAWALEIDSKGSPLRMFPLKTEQLSGKKTVVRPRDIELPAPVKRASNVSSNFLWDNAAYILGVDSKGDPARARKCFDCAKQLHLQILDGVDTDYARAICAFFQNWEFETQNTGIFSKECLEGFAKGENITFLFDNRFPNEDSAIAKAWQNHYDGDDEGEKLRCLVTGENTVPAAVHPSIKGVMNAQSSGAALVSFNAPAFCSFGREQNINAPVGKYASFAYTSALNYLVAARDGDGRPSKSAHIGDMTVVYWANGAKPQYQDMMSAIFEGGSDDSVTEDDIAGVVNALASGNSVDWNGLTLEPDNEFYLLGLAPNAARLSTRLFLRNTFGDMMKNLQKHQRRLEIVSDGRNKFSTLPLWALLMETVNQNSRDKSPLPQMAGDTLKAILTDSRYPSTLFQQTQLRIRADRNITWGRASIIKAYLTRNTDNDEYKGALNVELNENTTYQPYVLGRLFSMLEAVQQAANPTLNTTIKDKYFTGACATPAVVFPILLNLSEKHLRKLDPPKRVYYAKKIGALTQMLTESFPAHHTINDQGIFQLGYYHQTQKRFEKQAAENKKEEK